MKVEGVRVGDVLALQRRAVTVDPGTEYREIGIRSFGKGIFHKGPVTGFDLGNKRVFRIESGDLVISNVFAWEGGIALATEQEAGMIGSHRFMTFVARDGRIDPSWARWFFLSEPGLELIRKASPGSAGRNKTLAIERFQNLEIPLPPIDDQRRVAAHLDHFAVSLRAIEAADVRSRELRRATRAALTMRQANGDVEWRPVALGQVLTLRLQEVPVASDCVYPIAGVYSFGRGLFVRADLEGAKTSYRVLHKLRAGQVVMSRLKAWEGALAVVPPQHDGLYLSPEFPTFDIDPRVADARFLGAALASEAFWSRLKRQSKGIGARKERVSAERFLEQEISLPPMDEQSRLVKALATLDKFRTLETSRAPIMASLLPSALNEAFADLT